MTCIANRRGGFCVEFTVAIGIERGQPADPLELGPTHRGIPQDVAVEVARDRVGTEPQEVVGLRDPHEGREQLQAGDIRRRDDMNVPNVEDSPRDRQRHFEDIAGHRFVLDRHVRYVGVRKHGAAINRPRGGGGTGRGHDLASCREHDVRVDVTGPALDEVHRVADGCDDAGLLVHRAQDLERDIVAFRDAVQVQVIPNRKGVSAGNLVEGNDVEAKTVVTERVRQVAVASQEVERRLTRDRQRDTFAVEVPHPRNASVVAGCDFGRLGLGERVDARTDADLFVVEADVRAGKHRVTAPQREARCVDPQADLLLICDDVWPVAADHQPSDGGDEEPGVAGHATG